MIGEKVDLLLHENLEVGFTADILSSGRSAVIAQRDDGPLDDARDHLFPSLELPLDAGVNQAVSVSLDARHLEIAQQRDGIVRVDELSRQIPTRPEGISCVHEEDKWLAAEALFRRQAGKGLLPHGAGRTIREVHLAC